MFFLFVSAATLNVLHIAFVWICERTLNICIRIASKSKIGTSIQFSRITDRYQYYYDFLYKSPTSAVREFIFLFLLKSTKVDTIQNFLSMKAKKKVFPSTQIHKKAIQALHEYIILRKWKMFPSTNEKSATVENYGTSIFTGSLFCLKSSIAAVSVSKKRFLGHITSWWILFFAHLKRLEVPISCLKIIFTRIWKV